jgi:AcrR family transcriptional regulator
MGAAPDIIRKGRKYDQVLEGARTVFLRDGFEGASVDDIAREAGVSKATLYSYFPDKRLLFIEVAKLECRRQTDEADQLITQDCPVETGLTIAATKMVDFFLSDLSYRVFRICVAESDRFPTIGREFYENGPQLVRNRLVKYLEDCEARQELRVPDKPLAADQFIELCKADLFVRLILGVERTFSAADRARIIHGAVETFMARFGVKS